eukprot:COSAG01_NODE_18920_length_1043_cov_1.555085_2_plen_23_part_01
MYVALVIAAQPETLPCSLLVVPM